MQSKTIGYDKQFLVFDAKTGLSRTIYTYKAGDYIYKSYCPSCNKEIKINPKLKSVQCQYCAWTGHFQLELKSKESSKMEYQEKQEKKGKKKGTFEKAYDYKDETGKLRHQTVRYKNPKSFSQRRPYDKALDDKLGNYVKEGIVYNKKKKRIGKLPWVNSLIGIKLILYRLLELLKSKPQPVLIPEGEKDVDNLIAKGFCVTTNPMGALKWKASYNEYLKGRDVILIPDYDPKEKLVGDEHINRIGNSLIGTAKTIKVLKPKDSKGKRVADISVYLASNPDPKQLEKLIISKAVDFKPTELPFVPEVADDFSGGKRKDWTPHPLAKEIVAEIPLKYFTKSHHLMMYNKKTGLWTLDGLEEIRPFIRAKLDKMKRKIYYVKEVVAAISDMVQVTKWPDAPPANLIPFADKIADLKTGEISDYRPELFFVSKIKCPYIPEKIPTPNIDNFINTTLEEEDALSFIELLSYTLYRDHPYQKMFFFMGGGRNGKSKAQRLYQRVIGIENMSAITLMDLQYNKFQKIRLYGKFINFSPEIEEGTVLKKTSGMKGLTGGDPIEFEEKFKKGFLAMSSCKIAFFCNSLPMTRDSSDAFYRRIHIINFPQKFDEEESKENKITKGKLAEADIITRIPPKEINALAYGSFLMAQLMLKRRFPFKFTHHTDIATKTKQYEELSNPVGVFIEEKCNIVADPTIHVRPVIFKQKFREWQITREEAPWKNNIIETALKELGHKSMTMRVEGEPVKAYPSLEWKERPE